MLTQDTKKHIDAARQILVGVVPNPMSQVEQITNALIYKFMDDMDQQAIKAGGDPSFFVKDLEKYAWTKVMDSRLGNQERMNLYTEALMKFSEAKQLPQLFRDIFKQAFLPYRDPEVLGLFLKEISYFDYTHSEELGNAYEYLLSIMSSQGDAGQFRTPRHIIDFIVDVLAPTKDDTILDPACGTAGFLISAYNYIKRQNEGVDPETNKMRQLTADERRKLVNNFEGYDVDPTMVRMSQVNMYLHKFTTPKIYNYNTLASEDRWNDKFDLILANPPFMSPKGGIKPHNKFSVQANRAEVLFVDYIMNHLKPKGRAGIIVPEGIIFQSGKAYKELRKNLVNDGLFAVVSLPAGVFNPYSGVKTSILFFDNEVAKKTKDLLFVKVTSDGYDLGAQRRKIEKDDLGDTGVILKGFREYVRTDQNKETIESFISGSGKGFIVPKEKIAETDDYNLSADRYKATKAYIEAKYPLVKIGDIVEVLDNLRRPITKSDRKEGIYPYYGATGILDYVDDFIFDERLVLVGEDGAKWNTGDKTAFIAEGKYWVNNHAHVVRPIKEKLIDVYLVSVLNQMDLSLYITGVTVPKLNQEKLRSIEIPLPPLEVQKEIVEQIEVKQKAIEGAKQVIENLERERRYFGQSLRKLENVEWLKIGDILDTSSGGTPLKSKSEYYTNGTISWLKSGEVNQGFIYQVEEKITELGMKNSSAKLFPVNTVVIAMYGATAGKVGLLKIETTTNQAVCGIYPNDRFLPEFLYFYLRTLTDEMVRLSGGGAQPNISQTIIKNLDIPLVDISKQETLVGKASEQESIIESNKKLIDLMEKKIEEVLSEI
jgi:type I restriction enzyme M protein